ncbi:hypothetical protein Dimus_003652 [Dionaea muscipula]
MLLSSPGGGVWPVMDKDGQAMVNLGLAACPLACKQGGGSVMVVRDSVGGDGVVLVMVVVELRRVVDDGDQGGDVGNDAACFWCPDW